jgi:hypothetical protein
MRLNTKLMTSAALIGLLATTPVLAQDATVETPDAPMTEEVMPEADLDTGMDAELDAETDMGTDAEMDTDMDADAAVDPMVDAAPDTMTDATVDTTMDTDMAADIMAPEGYAVADITTFTVDQLLGVDIYGPDADVDGAMVEGEFIGNVTDLVLSDDQAVSEVITDVGGFLGIGQKSVALPAEGFTLFSDADGNLRGHVSMTREEIDALPEYVPPME